MFYVAAVMAFAPALVLMYVLLRPYTYPKSDYAYFSDPSFFILFSVGLIAGVIMFLVYTYVMNSVITVIVYAIVTAMFQNTGYVNSIIEAIDAVLSLQNALIQQQLL